MRKERLDAVSKVTPLFRQAEQSSDIAAADAAACIAEMLRVRATNNLPIGTGGDMIRMLTEALSAQVKARELFIEAHRLTPEVLGSLGLRAYGDENPCPPTTGSDELPMKVPLKVVA
ncbi:hypothetical protein QH494_14845 [Sphingomonas sp. AR_OL41]|jgi:hypothetical protein|uniref:hypothetical protein n=1 Tax=Parasphingomonas halimpatiens TaxID=3096162 RepID=UPI00248121A3|nr:hypothetical protein [Sphingomonas sp. AR_OL41]MDH7973466.1 hypothetical protein [Sphingomonas sp. AR_OL41]